MNPWSYPIASLISIALGWGVAWAISMAIGWASSLAANISFYLIGGLLTFQRIVALVRHFRFQSRGQAEATFPQDWKPSRRRRGYLFHGLFWVTTAIIVSYVARAMQMPAEYIWDGLSLALATWGCMSISIFLFASDQKILNSLTETPPSTPE